MNAKIQILPIMLTMQFHMSVEKIYIRAVLSELQSIVFKLFKWFESNHMKGSPGKPYILVNNKNTENVAINDVVLTSNVEEKLLGITIDSEVKFEKHIISICNKASQKIHAMTRIGSYMLLNKRRLLMKTFVKSQFNYCHLTWMFSQTPKEYV